MTTTNKDKIKERRQTPPLGGWGANIEIMDTTLRDGEQTSGVSFAAQ